METALVRYSMSKLTTNIVADEESNLNFGLCYWEEFSEISPEAWSWLVRRLENRELFRNNLNQETWD